MDSLDKAIKCVGTAKALAEKLGVKPMLVSHWKSRGVPATYCKKIEHLTGGDVTAIELRPDVFADVE